MSNLPTEGSSGQDSNLLPPRWSVERSQHYLPGAHEKREKHSWLFKPATAPSTPA